MRKLVIYDNNGKIFSISEGDFIVPEGLQHIIVDVPFGKSFVGVDLEATPHEPIFADIPPSEIERLRTDLDNTILEFSMLMMGGM